MDWIEKINNRKNSFQCKKGQPIFIEGSAVMGIYFIYQGKVKVTIRGANNKQQIVRLANNGHILGHRGFGNESYPVGAVAMEDSLICFIDNNTLNETFLANPEFTIGLMMFYSQELRKTEARIKYFSQMTAREKVIYALYYLMETYDLSAKKNILDIIISRQEIADIAGTTADQVSRTITDLKKEKVLNTDEKKIIILNSQKLREEVHAYFPLN